MCSLGHAQSKCLKGLGKRYGGCDAHASCRCPPEAPPGDMTVVPTDLRSDVAQQLLEFKPHIYLVKRLRIKLRSTFLKW